MSEQTKIDDGGPAFPYGREWNYDRTEVSRWEENGMSLRDWFAGQALVGILGARNGFLVDVGISNVGEWAYGAADAMLKARKEQP